MGKNTSALNIIFQETMSADKALYLLGEDSMHNNLKRKLILILSDPLQIQNRNDLLHMESIA
jgi:hypothetical protein